MFCEKRKQFSVHYRLCVIIIIPLFEQDMTTLKTKIYIFVNILIFYPFRARNACHF